VSGDFTNGHDVARRVWLGDQWLHSCQVDLVGEVVAAPVVGEDLDEVVLALLAPQEASYLLVGAAQGVCSSTMERATGIEPA